MYNCVMEKKQFSNLTTMQEERLKLYKIFSVGFSYPTEDFFNYFPHKEKQREKLLFSYDNLFRNRNIWLYTVEYISDNDTQKVNALSEIMGFYTAFGVKTSLERPDFLPNELEFMHYLIFKEIRAEGRKEAKEKRELCRKAQRDFFLKYLCKPSKDICEKIISSEDKFYREIALSFKEFIEKEKLFLTAGG